MEENHRLGSKCPKWRATSSLPSSHPLACHLCLGVPLGAWGPLSAWGPPRSGVRSEGMGASGLEVTERLCASTCSAPAGSCAPAWRSPPFLRVVLSKGSGLSCVPRRPWGYSPGGATAGAGGSEAKSPCPGGWEGPGRHGQARMGQRPGGLGLPGIKEVKEHMSGWVGDGACVRLVR